MPRIAPTETVTADELRRYLHSASVLLAHGGHGPAHQRVQMLRRARHWIAAAALGLDQLLLECDRAAEPTLDETGPTVPPRPRR